MNEREYDLLTTAPAMEAGRPSKEKPAPGTGITGIRRVQSLRAISRARLWSGSCTSRG